MIFRELTEWVSVVDNVTDRLSAWILGVDKWGVWWR